MTGGHGRCGPRPAAGVTLGFAVALAAATVVDPVGAQPEPATISGFVRAADFYSVEGATVRVLDVAETTMVDAEGRYSMRPGEPDETERTIEIVLHGYYRAVVRLDPASPTAPPVVLVPRQWKITAGKYAGLIVPIDLEGATGVACGDCGAFYARVLADEESTLPPGIPTWPPTAFPLQVGFDPDHGAVVSPRDSVTFWRAVESVEEYFGLRLFRPATREQALAEAAPGGRGSLLVILDPTLRSAGWGSSLSQSGDILAGSIHFRDARTFFRPDGERIVAHELVHALGFGHTCRWRSVVADVKRCRGNQASAPTPTDVAHAQLLWRIREIERAFRISTTVPSALPGYPLESH